MSHVPEGPIAFKDRSGRVVKTASWLPRLVRVGDILDINGEQWRIAPDPALHTAHGIVAAGWSTVMVVEPVK